MKKNSVKCPVCGQQFDPRTPFMHIQKHHSDAKESELAKIRDARRKCFGSPKPVKQKTLSILPQVAQFAAGFRKPTVIVTAR